MLFEIPKDIIAYLAELDAFIEREIKPLENADDNIRFFDHRREDHQHVGSDIAVSERSRQASRKAKALDTVLSPIRDRATVHRGNCDIEGAMYRRDLSRVLIFPYLLVAVFIWLSGIAGAAPVEELASLSRQVAELSKAKSYAEALPLAENAVRMAEDVHGPDAVEVSKQLLVLGEILGHLKRSAEAEKHERRALAIYEKALGLDHSDTAGALSGLAGSLQRTDRAAEAEDLLRRAVTIRVKVHGGMHAEVADALVELGYGLSLTGKRDEEIGVLARALAIYQTVLGPKDAKVGEVLGYIARAYLDAKKYDAAEPLLLRSLDVLTEALGPTDFKVADTLFAIALAHENMLKYESAVSYGRRAVAAVEKARPADDREALNIRQKHARLEFIMGNFAEAEAAFRRILAIEEHRGGSNGLRIARSTNSLAEVLRHKTEVVEAEKLLLSVFPVFVETFGEDYEKTTDRLAAHAIARTFNELGLLYNSDGRLGQAEAYFKRALELVGRTYGTDHADFGQTAGNLAFTYHSMDRLQDAETLYQTSIAIIEKARGPDHPNLLSSLSLLGSLYLRQRLHDKTEALYRRCMAISEKAYGSEHQTVADYAGMLGWQLKSTGKLADSGPILERTLRINTKLHGDGHRETVKALVQLGEQYGLEGRVDEAEELFRKAGEARSADIKEFPVYFATNRKRDLNQKRVAFNVERASGTPTFGEIKVIVPSDAVASAPARVAGRPASANQVVSPLRQLTLQPAQIGRAESVVYAARRRLSETRSWIGQALVFVHGYNTSFDNAVRRAGQLAYDLNFDGPVFVFSWPSKESTLGYLADRETAQLSADALREFMESVVGRTNASRIHIIAHSMGNVALVEAMQAMDPDELAKLNLGELVLASPDVDVDLFQRTYKRLQRRGATSTVYAASSDRALGLSSWLRDRPQLGYIPASGPKKLVAGTDLIDITAVNTDIFSLNHDLYARSPVVIADLRRLLKEGQRPPDVRSSQLKKLSVAAGSYWRFENQPPK